MKRFRSYALGATLLALLILPKILLRGAAAPSLGSVPSRIILTWAGDPARTQAVTWRTQTPLSSPQAQLAKFTADPGFEKKAISVNGVAETDDLGGGQSAGHYAVNFQGLNPKTQYCYRVGDGQTWSEWNFFRTASEKPEPFRFLYLGDAQNSIKSMWSRSIRAAYATVPDARFVVHAGDLVAEGNDDRLWGEWTDAMGFISSLVPSIPVPGNHDLHRPRGAPDSSKVLTASPLWHRHFFLPQNGPDVEELRSQSYTLDYQGVRFIALDVNVFANTDFEAGAKKRVWDKQVEWLNQALSKNPNRWTIVVQHQPIYDVAKGREYDDMRKALAPLYEQYHVDLVLQGHDHAYARTHKVAKDQVVDPAAPGVIYAISVSGPKTYELEDTHKNLMATMIGQNQFFQSIEVAPDHLLYKAYSIDGVVRDSFELRKQGAASAASTYVNHAPAKAAAGAKGATN
jgi:3',5'-cyclic AMP phosphodiesterase CpdA